MDHRLQLAQINIGRTVAPLDDPRLAGFVNRLAEINALADRSPGFVWRLQTASGDATSLAVFDGDPRMIINMSVWESVEALHHYVYGSAHLHVLRDRRKYFESLPGPYYALWWIARGYIPSVEEGKQRLAHLAAHGPSEHAFWFGAGFEKGAPPPEAPPKFPA
jgi:Domain of unknown function (DUF3291)